MASSKGAYMKNFLALMVCSILVVTFCGLVIAETSLPIENTGQFCIHRSTFTLEEVTNSILEQNLFRECENQGGTGSLKSLKVEYLGRKCPFGHLFNYGISGKCYIP
jgi:hypothetical protein